MANTPALPTDQHASFGWQRPVTYRQALLTVGMGVLLWLLLLGVLANWLYQHWQGEAFFQNQALRLRLPDQMLASADLQSSLGTRLNTEVMLSIPVNQQLAVGLPQTAEGQSHVNLAIPIDTQIAHAFTLNITAQVDTHVSIASWLPNVHVQFPLPLTVPITLSVPVRGNIPLSMNLHARARLPATVHVPIKTNFNVRAPIDQALDIATVNRAHFALHASHEDMPVLLRQAHLRMPLSDLVLQPTRLASDSKASNNIHSTTDRQIKPTALRK